MVLVLFLIMWLLLCRLVLKYNEAINEHNLFFPYDHFLETSLFCVRLPQILTGFVCICWISRSSVQYIIHPFLDRDVERERENTKVKMSFFGGEVGLESRSHNFHTHLTVPESSQKTNCVKWEKLQVHIPQWCTPPPLLFHAHINACKHTLAHTLAGLHDHCPSFGGGRKGVGKREILFHSDNALLSLPRDGPRKRGWNGRGTVSCVTPQQAAASHSPGMPFL